ncbi:MAG: thermostable hemolysin delta-VPH [Clostridia bacterium]|nr:thermostable hemolysin delta-VPH [Clostridia bacterium]
MYFNYHAKIKRLIEQGHCVGFERLEEYHKISPCILIYFDNKKPMPIREHRFEEYLFLFAKFGVKEIL